MASTRSTGTLKRSGAPPETHLEMVEAALKRLGLYADDEGKIKLISKTTLAAWLAGENARPHPAQASEGDRDY